MHTIQSGDSLYKLSRQYKTTVTELILGNPGINPYNLQVGMELMICPGADYDGPGSGNTGNMRSGNSGMPGNMGNGNNAGTPGNMGGGSTTGMPGNMGGGNNAGMPGNMGGGSTTGMPGSMGGGSNAGMPGNMRDRSPSGTPGNMGGGSNAGMPGSMGGGSNTGMPGNMGGGSNAGMPGNMRDGSLSGTPGNMGGGSNAGMPGSMRDGNPSGTPGNIGGGSNAGMPGSMGGGSNTGMPGNMGGGSNTGMPGNMRDGSPSGTPGNMGGGNNAGMPGSMGGGSNTGMPGGMRDGNPSGMPGNTTDGTMVNMCRGVMELDQKMRLAWLSHVYWARMYLMSVLSDAPDQQEVEERLLETADEIANVFANFLSTNATRQLRNLLTEHIEIAGEIIHALKSGNMENYDGLIKEWYANANQIANLLGAQNPYFSGRETRNMLLKHLDLEREEIEHQVNGEYKQSIDTFRDTVDQAVQMADFFARGLLAR